MGLLTGIADRNISISCRKDECLLAVEQNSILYVRSGGIFGKNSPLMTRALPCCG